MHAFHLTLSLLDAFDLGAARKKAFYHTTSPSALELDIAPLKKTARSLVWSSYNYELERNAISAGLNQEKLLAIHSGNVKKIFHAVKRSEQALLRFKYIFNPETRLVSLPFDIEGVLRDTTTPKMKGDETLYAFIRPSLVEELGVFEKKLSDWDLILIDLEAHADEFTGHELLDILQESPANRDEGSFPEKVIQFLAIQAAYHNSLIIL